MGEKEELADRTKRTSQYMDSLYHMSKYELMAEIHKLHLRCYMLNDYIDRLKKGMADA